MPTMILSNMILTTPKASSSSVTKPVRTNSDSSKSKGFASVLSDSVNNTQNTSNSSNSHGSADVTSKNSSNTAEQSGVAKKDDTSANSNNKATQDIKDAQDVKTTQDVKDAQAVKDTQDVKDTEAVKDAANTTIVDPNTLLMVLLQMNNSVTQVAGQTEQTVTSEGQQGEQTISNKDAKVALMQLLSQIKDSATQTNDLVSALNSLGKGTITNDQLTQAIASLTEKLQAEITGTGVATVSKANDSQLSVPTVKENSASSTNNIATTQQQESQNPNALLTALQGTLAGKFTVDHQGNLRSDKAAGNTEDSASMPLNADGALADRHLFTMVSTQQQSDGLRFDAKGLSQSSNQDQSTTSLDTTGGNFAQALSMEQTRSGTQGITESASQGASVKDTYQVVQQIVDQAKLITRAQNTEMVIQLKPEHLGELTLKVTVEQGLVNATFHSSNSDVRAAIEASLPQLKQELANTGLKVDNVGVYTSLDQSMSNQQQGSQQQRQLKFTNKNNVINFDDVSQTVDDNELTSEDGVDYRI